ncbi:phosphate ABC transporter ATP-binding protein [Candidatus Nitrospira nitrificans]|uniref:Phosphate transporter subunit ATP-binding component of ABC superfamily n=1 Tax=Candidatus Nitrospira nitrificans TaxID=1742973 RepID=A0A0S4LLI6_9BACT|nr:phosphate ABC transporter ATP-binding protein [Candidatus Nitrospira nitrificans]CUS38357.1 phosphate transporter subunit; ATP-binding component of ABC superfamily [Candidatus Nitrospira nitrificans]
MTPVEPITGRRPRPPLDNRSACCEPQPFIEIDRLSLHYGETPAFQDVTLSINKGCITALVGPSGCGKTSFLTCLNRLTNLIVGCRVSGRITIDTLDVLAPSTNVIQLRRRIGMIFQKPNPFPFSIRKNMELPLREHGFRDRKEIAGIIETGLRDVGLWDEVKDRLDSPALALSGGQQQRLCMARALVLSPEVLLMDEPCSALDPISSGVVEDLILSLKGRYTVLIVTHNLAQARRIADYAALLWVQDGAGRLIEAGIATQIFEAPREPLTAAYVSGMRG